MARTDRETIRVPGSELWMTRFTDNSGGYFSADQGKTPVALTELERNDHECKRIMSIFSVWRVAGALSSGYHVEGPLVVVSDGRDNNLDYWCNKNGWVENITDATLFSQKESTTLNLPAGGRWLPLEVASGLTARKRRQENDGPCP